MDSFLEAVQRACEANAPVSFHGLDTVLHAASSGEDIKEALYTLVDAYNTRDESLYRQAIMEAIGRSLTSFRRTGKQGEDALALDDHLMLAMFFNELSTVANPTLFCTYASALACFYPMAAVTAYGVRTNGSKNEAEDEEATSAKASIRSELSALRLGIAKRLSAPAPTAGLTADAESDPLAIGHTRQQAMQRAALDCLVCMLRAQMTVLRSELHEGVVEHISEEIKGTVEGLLGPLGAVLDEQQHHGRAQGQGGLGAGTTGGTTFARELGRGHGGSTVPASLLTTVLAYAEEVLWGAEQHANLSSSAIAPTPTAVVAAALFRHTISTLLAYLQRYLTLQQHRQTELAALGSGADMGGGGGMGGAWFGRGGASLVDVMRLYSVQHAVQRVLSMALTAASVVSHGKAGEKEAESVRLLTATLSNGLQAALAAFGGSITVTPPPSAPDTPATASEAVKAATDSWDESADVSHVARAQHALTASGGGAGDVGDLLDGFDGEGAGAAAYYDEDDDALLLGASREPLLKSSVGPVTAAALADMVMLSVAELDRTMVNKEDLRAVHLRGLEEMQYDAARRAQREELERQRMIERQGVEAIPATKLLDHVRDSVNIQAKGMATMRRVTARAVLEKAAFSSVLRSYAFVKEESEATVRAAQALIGRCLVQMPASMSDAALDEVFVHLQQEFKREQKLRNSNRSRAALHSLVGQMHSYYQLMLQVLFSFAAAQAPIHERGEINPLLLFADGATGAGAAAVAGGSATTHLSSHTRFVVDTENPIAFLQDENTRTPSYMTSAAMAGSSNGARRRRGRGGASRRQRKRPRQDGLDGEDSDASGSGADDRAHDDSDRGSGGEGSAYDDDDDRMGGSDDDDDENDFFFLNDTARHPCAYSHVLCRLMELAETCSLHGILVDVLLQAPTLTRYVWNYIYRRFCLSTTDQQRCHMGFLLLSALATQRPVYRTCAVNLLLHLCMSRNDYARRVAIISVGRLLSTSSSTGRSVVPSEVEAALVRYAKKQLAAVPGYHFTTVLRATRESGAAAALDEATSTALQAEEDKKAQEVLGRHLGLFLKLCARQPRSLFSTLLDVYRQCVARNNEVMVRLIPANKDVQAMTEVLLESDPATFLLTVVPFLRRYANEASLFVQSLLWTVSNKLRALCTQAKANAAAAANASGGSGERTPEYYRTVALGLLEHARAMYETSRIPLGARSRRGGQTAGDGGEHPDDGEDEGDVHEDENGFVLNDVRFLAPFFSLIPAAELREKYLPAFLYFVQVQLQFQRFYKELQAQQQQQQPAPQNPKAVGVYGSYAHHGSLAITLLSAKERSYVLTHDELKQFMALVVRESLVKAPYPFDDGAARGLSPVEFFVYLHRSPQESLKAVMAASAAANDGTTTAAGAATTPPIGIVTTKEVVSVCLELTRAFTFDPTSTSGTPKLYGPEEVQRAIKKMMVPPPVPSQLMATVLQSISALYPRGTSYSIVKGFLHFVVVNVLTPLERASAWETDPQLWKGVQLFLDKFYLDCSGFMVNLPDQVLIQALREQPRLAEKFREEHGNNASFAHILGNL